MSCSLQLGFFFWGWLEVLGSSRRSWIHLSGKGAAVWFTGTRKTGDLLDGGVGQNESIPALVLGPFGVRGFGGDFSAFLRSHSSCNFCTGFGFQRRRLALAQHIFGDWPFWEVHEKRGWNIRASSSPPHVRGHHRRQKKGRRSRNFHAENACWERKVEKLDHHSHLRQCPQDRSRRWNIGLFLRFQRRQPSKWKLHFLWYACHFRTSALLNIWLC